MNKDDLLALNVRWMVQRDWQTVLQIENLCFEYPWSEQRLLLELRQRNVIGMVVDLVVNSPDQARIAGFIVYELFKNRIEILTLAVHPEHQCQGYGRALIAEIKRKITDRADGRNRIDCVVRETNLRAQLFFRSQGFRATGVLRDYYDDPPIDEDAYQMTWRARKKESATAS